MNIRYLINILGKILFVEALLMLAPFAVAVYYHEDTMLCYAMIIALLLVIGGLSFIFPSKSNLVRAREGLVVTGFAWLVVSLFGALPPFLSGEIPSYLDSVFEIVSGFTTTGATILTDVEAVSNSTLFWRSFTHWIGGMGILVFALAILPAADSKSMHLMRAEVPGPAVDKLVAKLKLTARLLYLIYMGLTLLLVLLLVAGGMPLFDSLTHAMATAGTGGFSTKAMSIAEYNNLYAEIVITVFMLLFSINFNLFYLLLIGNVRDFFKSEELRWFLSIVVFSMIAIAINIIPIYGDFFHSLRYSSFQVATIISTTGFATANFDLWPNFSRVLLVVLMFFGACAGSTGGGMKITRVAILFKTARAHLKKLLFPRTMTPIKFEGKVVDEETRSGITAYAYAYFFVYLVSVVLLSFDQFSLTTNFTAVAACFNNIGPGLEAVGPVENFQSFTGFSKVVLIFDMLAGRLELFPIFSLFVPACWRK